MKQELAKVKQEEKKANAEVKSAYWGMFSNDKKNAWYTVRYVNAAAITNTTKNMITNAIV